MTIYRHGPHCRTGMGIYSVVLYYYIKADAESINRVTDVIKNIYIIRCESASELKRKEKNLAN